MRSLVLRGPDDLLLGHEPIVLGPGLGDDLLRVDAGVLEQSVLLAHQPAGVRELLGQHVAQLAQQGEQLAAVDHDRRRQRHGTGLAGDPLEGVHQSGDVDGHLGGSVLASVLRFGHDDLATVTRDRELGRCSGALLQWRSLPPPSCPSPGPDPSVRPRRVPAGPVRRPEARRGRAGHRTGRSRARTSWRGGSAPERSRGTPSRRLRCRGCSAP